MAQFEVITFAIELEVRRINDPCAGSPGHHFLTLSFADLEVVIKKPSWIDRQDFPAFADVFNCEIREFDFLTDSVFHTSPVGSILFSMSAANRPQKN